ncbi:MAG: peptide-methionine (S)-S-oxide reductase MsrA [Nitrospinae bacterium]|nr:peptide-methionine (S)-S-oxide reductase MsrA [Nitrospinota bacterium]
MKKAFIVAVLALTFVANGLAAGTGEAKMETATFAGGCFWCMEPPFEHTAGVIDVVSGYTGGRTKDPTYEEVSSGSTGHLEAVKVTYDPAKVSYETLLDVFWRNIDPTDEYGQFADKGSQYKPAIFFHTPEQKRLAEASKARLAKSGKFSRPIVVEIREAVPFYAAEEYHQDFYKKSALRYKFYRAGSGRDRYLQKNWGEEIPGK